MFDCWTIESIVNMSSVILQDITTDIRHPDSLITTKMFTVSIVFIRNQSDVPFSFVTLLTRASGDLSNNRLKVLYPCNYGSFIQNLSKGTLETLKIMMSFLATASWVRENPSFSNNLLIYLIPIVIILSSWVFLKS